VVVDLFGGRNAHPLRSLTGRFPVRLLLAIIAVALVAVLFLGYLWRECDRRGTPPPTPQIAPR
jgi:hypothetical protein